MPSKNGKVASEEIATLKKGVKFLFSSGYAADIIKSRCDLDENAEYITKPVDIRQLLEKIREMLDRDDAALLPRQASVLQPKSTSKSRFVKTEMC